MSVYEPYLDQLVRDISRYRPERIGREGLDVKIKQMLASVADTSRQSDLVKAEWELAVKTRALDVAVREGEESEDAYFATMFDLLDIVLSLSEQGVCEPTSPLNVFQNLLDTQTIPSCEILCGWLEMRVPRLTVAIRSSSPLALALLRTLNDILRRLSKSAHTPLCGRIMQLLASKIFPFGERSGLNLRGSFNASNTTDFDESDDASEFYKTFWSLQQYFRDPFILASKDADGPSIVKFRALVDKVVPAVAEATAKEKVLTGSKDADFSAGKKRKFRDMLQGDGVHEEGSFFPKFLTSTELLDYEMGDTGFRRTILLQLSIFLQHILLYTANEKQRWTEPKNVSLQMAFTLDADNEKWAKSMEQQIAEQLRQTVPAGRTMGLTAALVSLRENNWLEWKIGLCKDIAKPPIPAAQLEEVLYEMTRIASENRQFPDNMASSLVDSYEWGYNGPEDLEQPLRIPRLPDMLKRYRLVEDRVSKRRKQVDTARAKQEAANQRTAASQAKKPAPAATLVKEREKLAEKEKAAVQAKAEETSARKEDNALQLLLTPQSTPATPPVRPATPPTTSAVASPHHTPSLPTVFAESGTPGQRAGSAPPPRAGPPGRGPGAAGAPAPPKAIPPLPTDSKIVEDEMTLASFNWRALRIARCNHLQLFGSIGIGELPLLVNEIEKQEAKAQVAHASKADVTMTSSET